jgi:predicted ATPase
MITIISIGMYRHNEVEQDDAIFDLMSNLDAHGVRKTQVHLSGLNRDDLNSMVSETLQIFPRLTMSFSDTILLKTAGNPLFAREYMKSLVDSRMLKYSLRQRRWIWDGDEISSDSTTDNNVLRLLSNKMSSLPESTQKALKIASCFGSKVDESIITYLGSDARHSGITGSLDVAIEEGCIQRDDNGHFVWTHDKMREAAYSLIADEEKEQVSFGICRSMSYKKRFSLK